MRASILLAAVGAVVLIGCPPAQKTPEPPPPAPQIVTFSTSAERIQSGQKVTLSWETKNATRVELTRVDHGLVSGADGLTGDVTVALDADSLFVLVATNERGVRDTAAAWVQVDDGVNEVQFVASPSGIRAGEEVVLAWNAEGATTVSLAPKGGAPLDLAGQVESGAISVHPTEETVYVLTVDGKSFEATVRVRPGIDAFRVTPASALPGEPLLVSWKTSGARSVTLGIAGTGDLITETVASKVADGSFSWTVPADADPAAVYTFTLAAEGTTTDQVEKAQVVVYVSGVPKVREWNVPPYARIGGRFNLSWTTSGADAVEIIRDGTRVYLNDDPAQVASGSLQLDTAQADSTFQLRATHRRGGVDQSDLKTVNPVGTPTLDTFTATPQPGIASGGEPVTLTWNVPYARNLRISDRNLGTVLRVSGVQAETGSVDVYPNESTEYELTADNAMGQSITPEARSVTVTTPARLTFMPNKVPAGSIIELTGTTVTNGGDVYAISFPVKSAAGDAFIDIANTGTLLPFSNSDDTGAQLLTLPEPFLTTWAGVPVGGSTLSVNINGWMRFDSGGVTGDTASTTPGTLAVFNRDLKSHSTSKVLWQLDGTGDQRRLIIQWNEVPFWYSSTSNPTKRVTFQAQLYANGEVVFAYHSFNGLTASDSATIGIRDLDSVLIRPFANQVSASGTPAAGDTFRFFGKLTLPFQFTVGTIPLVVSQKIGTGHIVIQDNPEIIPVNQFGISEVNYNPATGADQWFEILNITNSDIDLAGWEINFGGGVTHTLSASIGTTLLPANGRLLVGQTANAAEGGATVDYVYGNTLVLPTASGSLGIGMSGGTYSRVAWTEAGTQGTSLQSDIRNDLLYASGVTTLTCPATQGYGTLGQLGTPGAANAPCFRWTMTPIPGAFQSIASTGTAITGLVSTGTNNSIDTVSRTVDFTAAGGREVRIGRAVYGNAANPLRVDSNGYITLSSTSNTGGNHSTPTTSGPNGTLAIFWDDLAANATTLGPSAVYWQQFDQDGTPASGDEYTLISWENWKAFGSDGSLNFQIKIIEATGSVEYHYGSMTSATAIYANGTNATVWFESLDGRAALPVSVNQPNIQPNTGYRFTAL